VQTWPLSFGFGQVGVIFDIVGVDRVLGIDDDAGARREGEPVVGAQMGRNARFENFDLTGANSPSSCAWARRAASTVMSTSAGLLLPSFLMRSSSSSSLPSMRLILMPVFLGESGIERLVGLVVAGRVDVQDFLFGLAVAENHGEGGKRQKAARD
jgi:hypothetical protein